MPSTATMAGWAPKRRKVLVSGNFIVRSIEAARRSIQRSARRIDRRSGVVRRPFQRTAAMKRRRNLAVANPVHVHYIDQAGLLSATEPYSRGLIDSEGSCPWPGSWARSYGAHLLV